MTDAKIFPLGILPGDGVGPEVVEAALKVLEAAGADVAPLFLPDPVDEPDLSLDAVKTCDAVLKGPLTSGLPAGWAEALEFFATIRRTDHMTLVREAASGDQPTEASIARYIDLAFAWAKKHGHRRITCVTKGNAKHREDGVVLRIFRERVLEHTGIKADHRLIDTATVALTKGTESFDLVVAPELYGDILGDVSAGLAGPLSLVASARVGKRTALFEPIHGAAPRLVGSNRANPTGTIRAATLMLRHLGRGPTAALVEAALDKALSDGVHTDDMAGPETTRRVSGRVFTQAVIARLGDSPQRKSRKIGEAA